MRKYHLNAVTAISVLLAFLSLSVSALFADEVGELIDILCRCRTNFVGVIDTHIQLIGRPQEVFFHQPIQGRGTLCYVRTERSIIAALDCRNGNIFWRHIPATQQTISSMALLSEVIVTVLDNGDVEALSAETGHVLWHSHGLSTVAIHASSIHRHIYILSAGSISKLDVAGEQMWRTKVNSDMDHTNHVVSTYVHVYVCRIVLEGTNVMSHQSEIIIQELDATTGLLKDSFTIPIDTLSRDTVFYEDNHHTSLIIWHEKGGTIKLFDLEKRSLLTVSRRNIGRLYRVVVKSSHGSLFLMLGFHERDEIFWDEMHRITRSDDHVEQIHDLPRTSVPASIACTELDSVLYVSRTYHGADALHVEVWDVNSRELIDHHQISDSLYVGATVVSSAIEVVKGTTKVRTRMLLSLSDGHVIMSQAKKIEWTRDEGLASIVEAILVRLPEPIALGRQSYSASPLQNFYTRFLLHFRKVKSHLGLPDNEMPAPDTVRTEKDKFGLNQYLVGFDSSGGIWAISTFEAGRIVWSVKLPVLNAKFVSAHTRRPLILGSAYPVLAVMMQLQGEASGFVLFDINVLNGSVLSNATLSTEGQLSEFEQYPYKLFTIRASQQELSVRLVNPENSIDTWIFEPPQGQRIVTQALSADETIASTGRVLGDRGVLYKFIDQSAVALITTDEVNQSLTVWLLSTVDGRILHQQSHHSIGLDMPIQLIKSENWIAYHFWAGGEVNSFQIVITEFYQGQRNVRAQDVTSPHSLTKIYLYDHELTTMSPTNSGQGITSRDLIVAVKSGEVATISRHLLDPRRVEKDKMTTADKEEMLVPYDFTLPQEPSRTLSHKKIVLGIERIISGPTLLESTSLICAFGLDIFITRVTPSMPFDRLGQSFSKSQIGISLSVLCAAIMITRPFAARKQLESRWIYFA